MHTAHTEPSEPGVRESGSKDSERSIIARHGQNERKSKNALFAGRDEGAATWGRIATLIETAKMNGVESYAYLKATLEAIAAGNPASKIDELLPWAHTPTSL